MAAILRQQLVLALIMTGLCILLPTIARADALNLCAAAAAPQLLIMSPTRVASVSAGAALPVSFVLNSDLSAYLLGVQVYAVLRSPAGIPLAAYPLGGSQYVPPRGTNRVADADIMLPLNVPAGQYSIDFYLSHHDRDVAYADSFTLTAPAASIPLVIKNARETTAPRIMLDSLAVNGGAYQADITSQPQQNISIMIENPLANQVVNGKFVWEIYHGDRPDPARLLRTETAEITLVPNTAHPQSLAAHLDQYNEYFVLGTLFQADGQAIARVPLRFSRGDRFDDQLYPRAQLLGESTTDHLFVYACITNAAQSSVPLGTDTKSLTAALAIRDASTDEELTSDERILDAYQLLTYPLPLSVSLDSGMSRPINLAVSLSSQDGPLLSISESFHCPDVGTCGAIDGEAGKGVLRTNLQLIMKALLGIILILALLLGVVLANRKPNV